MSKSFEKIPVRLEADLLILGGTSGAVAAALSARTRGLSVFLAAPRPYLGEDICASFDYWPRADDEFTCSLSRQLFPSGNASGAVPPTPMHVKRTLEQALVAAGIPFLLNAQPAGALRDSKQNLAGALIVHRGGREAIVAPRILDATVQGLFARQAGLRFKAFKNRTTVRHVTLGGTTLSTLDATELTPMHAIGAGGEMTLPARAYRVQVELDSTDAGSAARALAAVVEKCRAPGVFQQNEWLDTTALVRPDCPSRCDTWTGAGTFPLEVLDALPGLALLGPAAPVSPAVADSLSRPAHAMALGERWGLGLAALPMPQGPFTTECAGSVKVSEGELRIPAVSMFRGGWPPTLITLPAGEIPRLGKFDVVVVGGGTGGASAAIGAGRAGARTLVCESLHSLGGVGTLGQIACYWYGNRVGFTHEMDQGVAALEPKPCEPGRWSPPAKQAWLHAQCAAAGVSLWFGTVFAGAWVVNGRVRGVVVAGPLGYGLVEAGAVVDATGNADVAAAAGAEVTGIDADHVAVQGTGLAGIRPDRSYHNTDHTFSDDSDADDATQVLVTTKLKFKDHFDAGQLVDTRERRQIVGEFTLEPFDFLCARKYADAICVSSSNFDTHGFTVHPLFMVKPPDEDQLWVQVPFRCLLPRNLDGLLVTGLGISAHRDAIPVVRMQADVQNQGYAAGRAAAMAAPGKSMRDLDLGELRRHLVQIGNLPQELLSQAGSGPVEEDELKKAVETGWETSEGLALLFHEPARAIPLLKAALGRSEGPRQQRYALVLALLGNGEGAGVLKQQLDSAAWDKGWNYTGMGQFGASVSPIDTTLIALGMSGKADAWDTLLRYAASLPPDPEFSHCRALAESFEALYARHPHPQAANTLASLLKREGMSGHSLTSLKKVQAALTANPNETKIRNRSLRELYLARGAHHCGGHTIATFVLHHYSDDLRGHFAKHARALLKTGHLS